jgi:hypothetical protein
MKRKSGVGGSSGHRSLQIEALEPRNLLAVISMSGREQYVLELINRARAAPAAEAARLGVGLNEGLPAGTITTAPKQPLAPNQLLIDVAVAHTQDMLDRNFFDHTNPSGESPGDRIRAAGYPWISWAENIAWGTSMDADGFHEILFRSAGHRKNILKENVREIGIGIRRGDVLKGTEDFGNRWDDAFITGVAYSDDVVQDNFYTIGEGSEGLMVMATANDGETVYTTTTGQSGGYSLQVPPGTYSVMAVRADLPVPIVVDDVVIGASNSKVDFVVPDFVPIAPVAQNDRTMTEVGQQVVIDVLANDTGDRQQVIVTSAPEHGQAVVDTTTGAITYTPQGSFAGFDQISYQVRGSTGLLSNKARAQIAVIDLQNAPWTNPTDKYDANASGYATPEDVLILVDDLNSNGARILPTPSASGSFPLPYLDVSADNRISPMDILYIVDYLNSQLQTSGEGEGLGVDDAVQADQEVVLSTTQQPDAVVDPDEMLAIPEPVTSLVYSPASADFRYAQGDPLVPTRIEIAERGNSMSERIRRGRKEQGAKDQLFSAIGRDSVREFELDDTDSLELLLGPRPALDTI